MLIAVSARNNIIKQKKNFQLNYRTENRRPENEWVSECGKPRKHTVFSQAKPLQNSLKYFFVKIEIPGMLSIAVGFYCGLFILIIFHTWMCGGNLLDRT